MSRSIPEPTRPGRFDEHRLRLFFALSLVALALLTLLVYLPGVRGPFLLDDIVNLQALGDGEGVGTLQSVLHFVFGNRSGPAGRPVAMASFLLNARDWPVEAVGFKVTNLLLHVANGLLTAWLSLLLLRSLGVREPRARVSSLVVAALWLLHPLNVSTTLYVIQRMTQLMTLFALAGMICYVHGRSGCRDRPRAGLLWMSLSLFPFGLLAVLSKENGALLLLAILAFEWTVFNRLPRSSWQRAWLLAAVSLPLVILLAYLLVNFSSLTAAYRFREFSLAERLLTEPRVIMDYLFNILVPRTGGFSLQHDDFTVSTGLLQPLTTLGSLVFIVVLVSGAVLYRKRQPVASLAVFWFLGWHLLESSFLPLELYFEHRNYLPMIGPLLALVYYFGAWLERRPAGPGKRFAQAVAVSVLVVLTGLTLQLTSLWGNNLALAAHWAGQHPDSWRAQVEYAYLQAAIGDREPAYRDLSALQQRFPEEVALQLLRWNFACNLGFAAPYSLGDVAATGRQTYYRGDLTSEVKTLLDNLVAGTCDYPAREELEALLNRLAEVPMRAYESSGFHLLFSEFHVHNRELTPALIHLRTAFELWPDAALPIRQAVLSASARNYQDSLVFLQRAREADQNRPRFSPSRLNEIETMEMELRSMLGPQ